MILESVSHMLNLKKLFLIMLTIIATNSSVFAAQNNWQRITDQEASFTISFPGHPTYEEVTDSETGQPKETYSFYYNGHTLLISFVPIVPAPKTASQIHKVLSDTSRVYARNAGSLLRQEKLPGDGRQFDNLVNDQSGMLHIRSRVYVHQGKMFALSCGSYDANGINERIAEQFFSSFRFIDTSSKGQISTRRNQAKKSSLGKEGITRWYKLQGPDNDFIAEFPAKPDYILDTSSITGIPLHQYRFTFGENFFIVAYRERSNNEATSEQALKQLLLNYKTILPGWDIRRRVEMPDGYLLEYEGMMNGYPMFAKTRLYLRSKRLYLVTSVTKNLSGPNKEDVSRFFSSFRLLEATQ